MTLFASMLACVCWCRGIAAAGASRGGLFMRLLALFSALPGVAGPGETLGTCHLAGAALVFTGIRLPTASPPRKAR